MGKCPCGPSGFFPSTPASSHERAWVPHVLAGWHPHSTAVGRCSLTSLMICVVYMRPHLLRSSQCSWAIGEKEHSTGTQLGNLVWQQAGTTAAHMSQEGAVQPSSHAPRLCNWWSSCRQRCFCLPRVQVGPGLAWDLKQLFYNISPRGLLPTLFSS